VTGKQAVQHGMIERDVGDGAWWNIFTISKSTTYAYEMNIYLDSKVFDKMKVWCQ
jgi:hypothetical protein